MRRLQAVTVLEENRREMHQRDDRAIETDAEDGVASRLPSVPMRVREKAGGN